MIHFNSSVSGSSCLSYLRELNENYFNFRNKLFSKRCLGQFQKKFSESQLYLCSSATDALEMIALLIDIAPGDEVIMPSFTFVSTANAFVTKGATPVFIDIDPENGNIDPNHLSDALTPKTKAVILVHYLGISTNLSFYKAFCAKHNLFLIEDAAMAYGNSFDGKALGSHGDFGVISFDITKQLSAIQGGLLLVNNSKFIERAENIYHIGTNRTEFEHGSKPYYEWVDFGSKFQMNELNAAFLYDQIGREEIILARRNKIIQSYYQGLIEFEQRGFLRILQGDRVHEAVHAFVIVLNSKEIRQQLQEFLRQSDIEVMFHYIPLHTSPMGQKYGRFIGGDETTKFADCILRLPVHMEINDADIQYVCKQIASYFLSSTNG